MEENSQVSNGNVRSGNAHCKTIQLAFQFRKNESYSFSSTGSSRDDGASSSTSTAQIFMRKIKDALVIGIGVNSGHQTAFNTKFFHQNFSERSQAVSGARSIGDDVMVCRIIFIFIYTHNDGDIFLFSRSRDNNFFSTSFNVSSSFRTIGETTSGFNYDFNTEFAPRQFSRIGLSQYLNFFTINNDAVAINSYFVRESTMYRVIF